MEKWKKVLALTLMPAILIAFFACSKEAGGDQLKQDKQTTTTGAQTTSTTTEPNAEDPNAEPTTRPPASTTKPKTPSSGKKQIALTFDDGPHKKNTQKLLDGLKSRGVKATFFVLGQNVDQHPELVKRIVADGHCIANHTQDHKDLTNLSVEQIKSQVESVANNVKALTGVKPQYVRPPYGACNEKVEKAIGSLGYQLVFWSVDTNDWKYKDADHIKEEIIKEAEHGDIILMHDLYDTTVAGALKAIDALIADGYEFITIDELVTKGGRQPKDGECFYSMKK